MLLRRSIALAAVVLISVFGTLHRSPSARGTGAVSITSLGTSVIQDFDTLIASGTATWINDSTVPGWYHARSGTGTTIVANNGGNNAGNLYSYGTGTAVDRALGSVGSANTAVGNLHWGIRLANATGSTITSLDISYVGEQWRNSGAVAQTVTFSYRLGTGLGNALTDFTTGGTAVPELDFTSPVTGGTAAAIDGNATGNRTAISHTITGLNLAPGQEILLRWSDIDHAGADHGLAIDDLTIVADGGEPQPTVSIGNASVVEGDTGTTTASFTVTVTGAHEGVTFNIATEDGAGASAATVADADYIPRFEGVIIPQSETTFTFDVTVNGDVAVEPDETFIVRLDGVSGAVVVNDEGIGTIVNDDEPPAGVVISQIYGGGGNTGATLTHDFIELFNRGSSVVNLAGWSVQYNSAAGTGTWQMTPLSGSIAPGGYYLVQQAQGAGGTTPLPVPDATGTIAMSATAGKVALRTTTTPIEGQCPAAGGTADLIGYGGTANCFEGTAPTPSTANATAALRKRGGCFDSNNNLVDFSVGTPLPRNSATTTRNCTPISMAIHEIQGNGAVSPAAGLEVTTTGIVTAVKTNGFFLQTPDDAADADPATSQGLFVFSGATPAVAPGQQVSARGTASEFFGLTQIDSSLAGDVSVTGSGLSLPLPVTLTTTILDPAGDVDQLERFEGMLMHAASLTSVAPTNAFGETMTVLNGVARPMREPGVSVLAPVPPDPTTGVPDCCIPRFDENPERIPIDSDGLVGAPLLTVTSHVVIQNVTGPLDFTFGAYKLLPKAPPLAGDNISGVPVPVPDADEFTVGGFNIENFAGNETRRRKAALAIRQLMRSPDVIGHIEILDLATLQTLADQVNSDAVAAGEPNPEYQALLIPAPQGGTQQVGFLVKTSRVRVDALSQERAADTFINPINGEPETLHDRPPLVLYATVDPLGVNPRPALVVVNHLRSFIDIELVTGDGPRVRAKRKAQAESVAGLLQDLQTANPNTAIISVGDYNAFQFSDGYTDPIAALRGTPTPDDQIVVDESPDLVEPNFVNLTDTLPAGERYSFIFEGTPQALDHVLLNTVANGYVQRYAIARGNADFPSVPGGLFAGDPTRPEAASDHDMPVAYFQFPPPSADLAIMKTASTSTLAAGDQVSFTIVVSNTGTSPAQQVVVTDRLPSSLSLVSCSATGAGACGGTAANPTATFPVLAPGGTETVTIVATLGCSAVNGSTLSNVASVASTTPDPDSANNSASAAITASNTAPSITGAAPSQSTLLLPLHQMVPVTIDYAAADSCGPVTTALTVTSNEPVTAPINQQGLAGATSPDWQVLDDHHVLLRAERSKKGDGRIYTITISATDAAGQTTTAEVTVRVPRHIVGFID